VESEPVLSVGAGSDEEGSVEALSEEALSEVLSEEGAELGSEEEGIIEDKAEPAEGGFSSIKEETAEPAEARGSPEGAEEEGGPEGVGTGVEVDGAEGILPPPPWCLEDPLAAGGDPGFFPLGDEVAEETAAWILEAASAAEEEEGEGAEEATGPALGVEAFEGAGKAPVESFAFSALCHQA
jgi:hypothetical protein